MLAEAGLLDLNEVAHVHAFGQLGFRPDAGKRPDTGTGPDAGPIDDRICQDLHIVAYGRVRNDAVRADAHVATQRHLPFKDHVNVDGGVGA